MIIDYNKLAEDWILYFSIIDGEKFSNKFSWSSEIVDMLVLDNPMKAIEIIVKIYQNNSSLKVLPVLSAGPLEDLIKKHYKNEKIINRIIQIAKNDNTMKFLLGGVWVKGVVDADSYDLLKCNSLEMNQENYDKYIKGKKGKGSTIF